MNKKIIFFLFFLLMVSFSAGVFVEVITSDQLSLSTESVSFWNTFQAGCKNDLTVTIIVLLFSLAAYTVPFTLLLILVQVFSLGFSAAYLMSVHPQGLPILLAVLLPRCLLKLPVYVTYIVLSFNSIKLRFKQSRQRKALRPYAICLAVLIFSSLLEAFLHLLIVSP